MNAFTVLGRDGRRHFVQFLEIKTGLDTVNAFTVLGCDGRRHFVQFLEGSIQVLVEPLRFLLPIELQYFPGLGTEYDFGAGTLWRLNTAGIGLLSKKNTRDHGRSERRGTHRLRNWYLNIEQGNNLYSDKCMLCRGDQCYAR